MSQARLIVEEIPDEKLISHKFCSGNGEPALQGCVGRHLQKIDKNGAGDHWLERIKFLSFPFPTEFGSVACHRSLRAACPILGE